MLMSLIGWLGCAAGAALALRIRPAGAAGAARPVVPATTVLRAPGQAVAGRFRRADAGSVALLALCAIGAAVFFVPSWDSYTLAQSSSGTSSTITAGNAFQNPGTVIEAANGTV